MKPLFTKDLEGWEGNPKLWSFKDGIVKGETTKENPTKGNTFLIWKGGTVAVRAGLHADKGTVVPVHLAPFANVKRGLAGHGMCVSAYLWQSGGCFVSEP